MDAERRGVFGAQVGQMISGAGEIWKNSDEKEETDREVKYAEHKTKTAAKSMSRESTTRRKNKEHLA